MGVAGNVVPDRDRLWTEETRHPTVIFGLDVSPEMLRQARLQANAANISYQVVGNDARIPAAADSVTKGSITS